MLDRGISTLEEAGFALGVVRQLFERHLGKSGQDPAVLLEWMFQRAPRR